MINKRFAPQTVRCNWCFRINPGKGWITERRRRQTGAYSNVICRRCVDYFFGGEVPHMMLKEIGIRPVD